jgi:hypothetical protein
MYVEDLTVIACAFKYDLVVESSALAYFDPRLTTIATKNRRQ